MKTIFKKGDKVFDIRWGWGYIIEINNDKTELFPIIVRFENEESNDESYTLSGRYWRKEPQFLSFTEYTLEGLSQERPEELPNKGDIVWIRNEFPSEWEIGYFLKKEGNTYYISSSKGSQGWRSAGLEMTITDPYEK